MVYLAPPLKAVLEIRFYLEQGISVPQSVRLYVQKNLDDSFAKELSYWLFAKEQGKDYKETLFNTFYRKHLLEILNRGLKGEPILTALNDFEQDLIFASNEDLEQYLQKLPFITLIPLMLFAFPAFFIMLTGPMLLDLLNSLQNEGGAW